MDVTVTAVLSKFGQLGAAAQQQNQAALRSALRARGLDLKPSRRTASGHARAAAAHARRRPEEARRRASPDQQKAKLRVAVRFSARLASWTAPAIEQADLRRLARARRAPRARSHISLWRQLEAAVWHDDPGHRARAHGRRHKVADRWRISRAGHAHRHRWIWRLALLGRRVHGARALDIARHGLDFV